MCKQLTDIPLGIAQAIGILGLTLVIVLFWDAEHQTWRL
jgi:hypothetical protein